MYIFIFIVIIFLWTPLIKNQILRYVVYQPHLFFFFLLLLLYNNSFKNHFYTFSLLFFHMGYGPKVVEM